MFLSSLCNIELSSVSTWHFQAVSLSKRNYEKFQFMKKLAKLRRHASRVSLGSKSLGPINQPTLSPNWGYAIWQEENGYPFFLLTKLGTPNLMRELVTGVGKLSPNFFDPTCVSYKVCKFIHFLLHLCFVASAFVHCSYIRFLNLSLTYRARFSLEKQTIL